MPSLHNVVDTTEDVLTSLERKKKGKCNHNQNHNQKQPLKKEEGEMQPRPEPEPLPQTRRRQIEQLWQQYSSDWSQAGFPLVGGACRLQGLELSCTARTECVLGDSQITMCYILMIRPFPSLPCGRRSIQTPWSMAEEFSLQNLFSLDSCCQHQQRLPPRLA